MRLIKTIAILAAVAPFAVNGSLAQTELSRNQIINSLQGAQTKATLNAADIRAQALLNIKQAPGKDAPRTLSISEQMASLRQFNIEITFDFDSARIRHESYETIGLMADALHTPYLMGQKFIVVGHTDAKGDREYNLELSQRRAQAIMTALVTTFRVPLETLEAVGLGEEQLRDPDKPYDKSNRRVQLLNIGF